MIQSLEDMRLLWFHSSVESCVTTEVTPDNHQTLMLELNLFYTKLKK